MYLHKTRREQVRFDLLERAEEIIRNHVNPKEFDLHDWKCETTACAISHLANDPFFQQLGLRVVNDNKRWNTPYKTFYVPIFKEGRSWGAVDKLFNFDPLGDDGQYLFCNSKYEQLNPTPTDVANRIREYINKYKPR